MIKVKTSRDNENYYEETFSVEVHKKKIQKLNIRNGFPFASIKIFHQFNNQVNMLIILFITYSTR